MCCYTLLGLGGRGPLCGIGLASRRDATVNPCAPESVRMTESRPDPTPFTTTCSWNGPVFWIFSSTTAVTFCAAKGVAFFGPENPSDPADAHVITFPDASVTVISVLLYDACTYTCPLSTFLDDCLAAVFATVSAAFSSTRVSADCCTTFFLPMVI